MKSRLIESALVVFKLLIFKVCGTIGFSKIRFSNFSSTGRVEAGFTKDIVNVNLYYFVSKDSLDISFTSCETCETGTLGIRRDTLRHVNEVINTFFINLTHKLLFWQSILGKVSVSSLQRNTGVQNLVHTFIKCFMTQILSVIKCIT